VTDTGTLADETDLLNLTCDELDDEATWMQKPRRALQTSFSAGQLRSEASTVFLEDRGAGSHRLACMLNPAPFRAVPCWSRHGRKPLTELVAEKDVVNPSGFCIHRGLIRPVHIAGQVKRSVSSARVPCRSQVHPVMNHGVRCVLAISVPD